MRVCPHCHLLLADSETACAHDGTATAPVSVPGLPPGLEHKFRDLVPFAKGQTGCLWQANLVQGGEHGLLKVMPLSGFEPTERVRLKRELRKQGRLAHDGLPRIIDGGEVGQDLWLFRQLLTGESLAQRIRRLKRIEPMHALLIAAQVASALDELQRNGLLHRDVKPGHVILQDGPQGMPVSKLIDAGVAARLPSESVFDLVGTPAYVSPEQAAGKLVSFRSDLYALGCLLFEMLTGAPPFPGDDVKAVLEAHKNTPPPELDPALELPAAAQALLRALLSKDPRQRPFSAQQVRRTLEPLLPPGAPLPSLQSRAPSSAGGISAPPEERGRAAAARPSTPRGERKSRPSAAPPVPRQSSTRQDKYASGTPTEEIDLAEIELPSDGGPRTVQLSPDELEELDPAPNTMQLDPADISIIESLRVTGQAAALSDAVAQDPDEDEVPAPVVVPPEPLAAASPEPEPELVPEPEPVPVQPKPEPAASVAPVAAAAPPAESTPAAQPARRSIDFDVESLFDDEVAQPGPGPNTLLNEAAPTQLWRPKSEPPPAAPAAPANFDSAQAYPPVEADPEGTVVAARPGQRRGPPWLWIGAGAAAVLALAFFVSSGSDEEPAAPAASANGSGDEAHAAAAAQGEPPAPSAAVQPAAQPQPAAALPPEPEPSAATAAARAEPTAAEPAAAEPAPVAAPPATQAAAPAAPAAPAATKPAPSTKSASQPAPAEPPATISAAVASARVGPASGSKLVPPKGARSDRLAKAEEFKQQGRAHYQAGRYREAAIAYQNATEQDPSDAGAFAGVAASRLAAGDADAAIAAYSRAVRLQPNSSGFHAALGRAYLTRGDRARARAAYEKALELNPENGAAKTALAQLK